ncbi:MAG: hypothetical protein KF850_00345 [Labilithrix sp.]|nr:hypothetical protein [Labilithrix sp.]
MHRHLPSRSIVLSSLLLVGALVGCGAPDDGASAAGPPPSESVVFAASADTKADLGIATWGFATDADGDLMTYRGYGDGREVLATVVQELDRSDPTRYRFTLTMTGRTESASQKIEFSTRPSDDGKDALLEMLVTENTFEEGALPSRVLARFKADSAAREGTTVGSGSLTGRSRPLEGNGLVTRCSDTVDRCQTELIDSRIAAAAASSDCGLIKTIGQPLIATVIGAGAGALATIWGGPTAVVGAALGGGGALAASGVAAATQCVASRRDATNAAQQLATCRQQAASCATQ